MILGSKKQWLPGASAADGRLFCHGCGARTVAGSMMGRCREAAIRNVVSVGINDINGGFLKLRSFLKLEVSWWLSNGFPEIGGFLGFPMGFLKLRFPETIG